MALTFLVELGYSLIDFVEGVKSLLVLSTDSRLM